MIIQPTQPQLSIGHGASVDENSVTKANPSMDYQSANENSTGGAELRLPPEQPEQSNVLDHLRCQVEFYFSNFANDSYLQQCSAAYGGSVPLAVIASFPKVRERFEAVPVQHPLNLHAQIQLLNQALEVSEMLTVSHDGLWIIPATPVSHSTNKERTTVIVRDLPLECEEEDVMNAFTSESNSPKAARPDVGNTWYVTFESEAQALEALATSQNRLIEGHPIKARLKSELTAPPTVHVETTKEPSMSQQHPYGQQQHQPHYNMAMAQHHYHPYSHNNGVAMHHHQPYTTGMPSHSQQSRMMFAANPHHMPYGMAAVYPANAFYMDHPQHLLVPVPPQMAYHPDYNIYNNDAHHSQTHGIPTHVYGGRNYNNNQDNNDGNNSESGNHHNHYSNQPKKKNKSKKNNNKSKKNRNGPNANQPYNNGNNNNGERRLEQASSRGESSTGDSQGQNKERRENPSPPHGRNKDSSVDSNSGNEYSKNNNSNKHNYNDNIDEDDDKNNRNNKVNNNGVNGKKKRQNGNKKKAQHQRSNSNSSAKIINDEQQFPALGGGAPKQKRNQDVPPQRPAYAEALLKAPTVVEVQSGFEQMTVEESQQFEEDSLW